MILVVDFEATCWERRKQDLNELIEIGVVVCSDDCDILGTFSSPIRPLINKRLSERCKKLTGITQKEVDAAVRLPEIIDQMNQWFLLSFGADIAMIPWGSWGSSDTTILKRDCERHELPYPLGEHLNFERRFCAREGIRGCGVARALEMKGFVFEGRQHRALNDALNLQKIASYILAGAV